MLEIFDKSRKRIAIAENASGVEEERKINSLWYLTFSLPYNDAKNEYCQPFNYIRYNGGELYRIMPVDAEITETGLLTYQCEHVLATLIDNVLFGYHVVGNRGTYTADCIRYVLNRQCVQNWVLYECDFARQFEYGWTQETLLSALFSIATPLSDYMWVTDTSVYPWRLSLKSIGLGQKPQLYVAQAGTCSRMARAATRSRFVPGSTPWATAKASTSSRSRASITAASTFRARRSISTSMVSLSESGLTAGMRTLSLIHI